MENSKSDTTPYQQKELVVVDQQSEHLPLEVFKTCLSGRYWADVENSGVTKLTLLALNERGNVAVQRDAFISLWFHYPEGPNIG